MKALFSPWALIVLLAGRSFSAAQIVEVSREGTNVILTWEGNGVLQFAPAVAGPWENVAGAESPHRAAIGGDQQFFRAFYPQGFHPLLEPPGLAFAEPNAAPAMLAHELAHVVQQRGWSLPEIGDEVLLHSGESRRTEVDLHIRGRGLDFIWARTYRSRHGSDTAQGKRWDFSYNVRIQGGGPHVKVFDGRGHSAYFVQQPDGRYVADQFFREGRFDSNGVFRLTFADTGVWEFRPLDGQPAAGKISRIADRNGNQLAFLYDLSGRLTNVADALNRSIQVAYNGDGFIESVTDFAGRQVRYEYYQDFELGGSFGDLKSARSPIVTNTPTLNDYPLGKKTTYAYSEGFADDRENHLLLSITDPRGQTSREYIYQHNQSDPDFLHCRTMRLGYSSNLIQFHYVGQVPALSNQFAVRKVIVNDRAGNVSEHFLDSLHRRVLRREYTGRADPGQPTTETLNRPMNPLRSNDPPYFETSWEWSVDSLPTRILFPNGNSVSNVYELALNPAASRPARGNLRERRLLPGPLGGDQNEIVWQFEHHPRFGTERSANAWPDYYESFCINGKNGTEALPQPFFTKVTNPRSNATFLSYDDRGNRTNVVRRLPTIIEDFEFNGFGQVTARVFPDNGGGFRRRDTFVYYTGGPQTGYLQQTVADSGSGGFNQTTTYTYDSVGNLASVTDPRGNDSLFTHNALAQLVQVRSRQTSIAGGTPYRLTTDCFYDANDNLVRVCESNADELGRPGPGNAYFTRLFEYDILDRLVRLCAESGSYDVPRDPPKLDCSGLPASEFVTTEFDYDPNGNLSLVRFGEASEGRQPANTVRLLHDERDLPFRRIQAEGDVAQSSLQLDYDFNGNLNRTLEGLESNPRVSLFAYDGFNRGIAVADAMGNVLTRRFDPNGNAVSARIDGETNDFVGSAANVRLSEVTNVFDAMDRLQRVDVAFFDVASGLPIGDGQSTTLFTYSDSSQLLTRVDDNNRVTIRGYDRLHRLQRSRDARSNEVFYAYDSNSNPTSLSSVEKSDLGNPDQSFATRYVFDARDRLVQVLDNISNAVQYAYDSRNNLVLTTDPLSAQTRLEYDGLTRLITVVQDMNTNGPGSSDPADILRRTAWDDSSRLVSRSDDNTNVTAYVYDALNRRVREVLADGTGTTNSYDVHDNVLTRRDGNGNAVNYAYDLLNRMTNKTVVPGPNVSADTTFERFRYDGLSRLTRAEDDDSLVELAYNSLGRVLQHGLNGATTSGAYDGEGNVLSSTYPGGRVVQFTYDPLNRIKTISNALALGHYVGPGRIERLEFANGTRADYSYDGITGIPNSPEDFGVKQHTRTRHTLAGPGTVIDDRTYTWNRRYSKTSRNDVRPGGPAQLHQYAYDAADRIARGLVTHPSLGILRDTRYTLDGVGNRTSVTNLGGTSFYALDPATPAPADFQVNQYTTTPFDTRQYDENGNLRALNPGERGERLMNFDYADRLVRSFDPGDGVTNVYAYDALGRRIQKTVFAPPAPPQVIRYRYGADWAGHLNLCQRVEEQDGAGATLATYVYGAGLKDVLNMQRGGDHYYFHRDDLDNVMAITDASGAAVERYDYDDFGEPEFFNGAGAPLAQSAIGNPHLFAGGHYDDETGLYCFRNRYVDPAAGRFISRDPPGAANDSTDAKDPLVAFCFDVTISSSDLPNSGNAFTFMRDNPWSAAGSAEHNFRHPDLFRNIWINQAVDSTDHTVSRKPGSPGKPRRYLYFAKVAEARSPAHGHLDYLKQVGDPASAAGDTGTHEVGHYLGLEHNFDPSPAHDTSTHEVGHWMGLYHTFNQAVPGGGMVDAADYVIWRRSSSPVNSGLSHPEFAWYPAGPHADKFGRIKVQFSWTGGVDASDYILWRKSSGSPIGEAPGQAYIVRQLWNGRIEGHPDVAGLFRDTAEGETGRAQMDGAILVVHAADGPMP